MRLFAIALSLVTAGSFCSAAAAQSAPAQQSAATKNNSDAQFVEVLAKLASLRLERINRINAKVPGSVPPDDVSLLELEAKSISKLKQDAKNAGQVSGYSMLLSLAEVSQASAAQEWKRVSAIQQRSPGSIPEQDAEGARLRAELAEMTLARGKSAATKSPQDQQNWALQFLFVELHGLRDAVRSLEERQ